MKRLFFTTLLLTSFSAYAEKIDKFTDAKLNLAYQQTIKNHSEDPHYIAALKQAQRDWLKYRESQCEIVTGTYYIHTEAMSEKFNVCINNMNEQRIKFLNMIDTIIYED